jgi:hypothetical protein
MSNHISMTEVDDEMQSRLLGRGEHVQKKIILCFN